MHGPCSFAPVTTTVGRETKNNHHQPPPHLPPPPPWPAEQGAAAPLLRQAPAPRPFIRGCRSRLARPLQLRPSEREERAGPPQPDPDLGQRSRSDPGQNAQSAARSAAKNLPRDPTLPPVPPLRCLRPASPPDGLGFGPIALALFSLL
jgi:hypothetical protein